MSEGTDRNQPVLNRILSQIPGFSGYLEQQQRRESDEKAREWMADRLQQSKRGMDAYTKKLVDAGKIDELPGWEQLRGKTDALITRIRSRVQGYSGLFDAARIDEDALEDVYDCDADLLDEVDALAAHFEELSGSEVVEGMLAPLLESLEGVEARLAERDGMLKKLIPGN